MGVVEDVEHIVTGCPSDKDDVALVDDTMKIGGRGNNGVLGGALGIEIRPIGEFAGDESTKESVDLLSLDIGGGQTLTMGIVGVEEKLFEHFAGEVRVYSDEASGVCGGGMLKKFGEMMVLGG